MTPTPEPEPAVHRSGQWSAVTRALLPLALETARTATRHLTGASRPPTRQETRPTWDTEPGFADATWVIGREPGTLLHHRLMRLLGTTGALNPATAHHIEYVTTDGHDRTITATGALFRSHRPHRHPGPRPLIAFAPSTQGVAPHCDPSYTCTVGLNVFRTRPRDVIAAYELPAINLFLAAGCDVVITDYPRDPDLGLQLYCDHPSGARALIDAVRAAHQLGVPTNAPLGFWGFSQGAGTVARALEDADYAPQVTPRAAVVGSPPAQLDLVLRHVDGSLATGVVAYATAGLMVTSPEIREEILSVFTPEGLDRLIANITTCTGGSVLASAWHTTAHWTRTGHPLGELLDDLPAVAAEFTHRRLGQGTPRIPVLLWGSRHDDIVPFEPIRQLRDDWLSRGARIIWRENTLPRLPGRTGLNHFAPYFQSIPRDAGWLLDQVRR